MTAPYEIHDFVLRILRRAGIEDCGDYSLQVVKLIDRSLKESRTTDLLMQLHTLDQGKLLLSKRGRLEKALAIIAHKYSGASLVHLSTTAEFDTSSPVHFVAAEEIESFSEMARVPVGDIVGCVPLNMEEEDIKNLIQDVVGEPFHFEDWGGEKSDIMTHRLLFNGRRVRAAFMLKGRGTRGPLTPAKCGKSGDQIIRLFSEPAEMYVIQHVDKVESSITSIAQAQALLRANSTGERIWVCIMDGVDTARLARAYRKV